MICTAQLRRRRPVQERRVWSFKYVRATASNRSDPRQLVEVLTICSAVHCTHTRAGARPRSIASRHTSPRSALMGAAEEEHAEIDGPRGEARGYVQ